MAEPKTRATKVDPENFLAKVKDPEQRSDAQRVATMMAEVTGAPACMWGTSIVGFGRYDYTNTTGKTRDWPRLGLSPRANNLTLYLMAGFDEVRPLLAKLGPHSLGKACLYLKRLADVDQEVLRKILSQAAKAPLGDERDAASKKTPTKKKAPSKKAGTPTQGGAKSAAGARTPTKKKVPKKKAPRRGT